MELTRYLLFTSLVKHGEMLRYLFAAQERKRLLEQYQLRRQVKSSALTGNPDRIFEVYYIDRFESEDLEKIVLELKDDCPSFKASLQVTEGARIKDKEDRGLGSRLEIPPAVQMMSQMPYLTEHKGRQACSQTIAEAPYLLHVTCALHDPGELETFTNCMSQLIKEFEKAGLSLVAAGQRTGTIELSPVLEGSRPTVKWVNADDPVVIMNVWEFENPDSVKLLMTRHAESQTYAELDEICDQEQHFCRNVSRHYQRYPLLGGKPLSIT